MSSVIKFKGKTYYSKKNTADEAVIELRLYLKNYSINLAQVEWSRIDATISVVDLNCYRRS